MKNNNSSNVNVFNILIFLALFIFIKSIILLYYNYKTSMTGALQGFGLVTNVLLLLIIMYLLSNFKFSNKMLLTALYLLLIKPILSIFAYLQKTYNLFGLNQNTSKKLEDLELKSGEFSSVVSLVISCYIVYYIFLNR